MKRFYTLLALIFSLGAFAQAPNKFSYQAVVRDASSQLVVSTQVGVKISILQGSVTGSPVYVETSSPSTNVNGLFSIQIGNGTVVSGDFSLISWSNSPYFIKSEIDPAGGTDYTIEAVSELLSVPYALYADSAGNAFSGSYNDLSDKPDFVSQTAFNDSIVALKELIADLDRRLSVFEPKVGDFKDGGIIGYIFQDGDSGYFAGETHGIIVALDEEERQWIAGGFVNVLGTSGVAGTGKTNTDLIIAGAGANNAAGYANGYSSGGFDDWFLPSSSTLYNMWLNRADINSGLARNNGTAFQETGFGYYWSSTNLSFDFAARLQFSSGSVTQGSKSNSLAVRPVRKF